MVTNKVNKFTKVLVNKKIITVDNREIINYGLSTGIELILNLITTLTIGLILNMVLESIVFVVSFAYIRVYAGGYHLNKATNCYLISNGIVALVLLAVMMTPKESMASISLILLSISIPIILQFAPIGTRNKPLSCHEKYYFRQKVFIYMSIELIIIFFLLLFGMINSAFLVSLGIFVSSVLIVIATYKQSSILEN